MCCGYVILCRHALNLSKAAHQLFTDPSCLENKLFIKAYLFLYSKSNKMLSFLELLDFKLMEFGKKKCIWKGNG